MKIFKVSNMSTSCAIIMGSIIIGVSIFLTTWIFFGGEGNRLKLSTKNPTTERPAPPKPLSAEEIKKLQEQRAEQIKKTAPTPASDATSTEE